MADGTVIGDPQNAEFTEVLLHFFFATTHIDLFSSILHSIILMP